MLSKYSALPLQGTDQGTQCFDGHQAPIAGSAPKPKEQVLHHGTTSVTTHHDYAHSHLLPTLDLLALLPKRQVQECVLQRSVYGI